MRADCYLQARGWWPAEVAALDLVRILPEPEAVPWPAWWPRGRARRWRLAMLGYEPDGTPASIHARATELPGWPMPEGAPAKLWPKGFDAAGLLFADRAGLALLRGEGPPPALVFMVEGLTDTLSAALRAERRRRTGEPVAVLGLVEGSALALARVAWPPGTTIVFFHDMKDGAPDGASLKYAAAALDALPNSVTFLTAMICEGSK